VHKSERLLQLINLLKGRRLATTAQFLAEKFAVSERTIYRDIQHLQSLGVPVSGEAGIGYMLSDCDLPPMMFSYEELQALLLGSNMVSAWTDPLFSQHAKSALVKIEAVLPPQLKQKIDSIPYLVSDFHHTPELQQITLTLRQAIQAFQCVELTYTDAKNQQTQRLVEPLGLIYWGGKWTLVAHCRLRNDYREFRLDRIETAKPTPQTFTIGSTKSLNHHVNLMKEKYGDCDAASAQFYTN